MKEIEQIASNLIKKKDGIYYSKTTSKISYPEDGNEACLQLEEDSFWFKHRNSCIITAVKKYSQNKIFYDIGGGNGFVAKGLQKNGIETVLIEPGEQGAKNGKKRLIRNVICSTLDDAQFEKATIDSVGLFDVVEHIEDDKSFLTNINSFMKKGNYIYITVPAYNFLWSSDDVDAKHYRRYTLKEINKILVASGFKIKYSTYIFSILPMPVFLFRTIPTKLGFIKNKKEQSEQKKEHSEKKGIINFILGKIWNWELNKIANAKKIYFGGSCFVIAEKI